MSILTVDPAVMPGHVIPDGTHREAVAAITWTLHQARLSAWRHWRDLDRPGGMVFDLADELDVIAGDAMADSQAAGVRRPGEEAVSACDRNGVNTSAIRQALAR